MLDRRLTNRIRSIFLHDEQRVTIETGADLLREERDRLAEAIPGFAEAVNWPLGEEAAAG